MSDTAERVKKIVVEHLGVEEDKVVENASFIDDLGADSLDTVELVLAFEEEFNIEMSRLKEKVLAKQQSITFGVEDPHLREKYLRQYGCCKWTGSIERHQESAMLFQFSICAK